MRDRTLRCRGRDLGTDVGQPGGDARTRGRGHRRDVRATVRPRGHHRRWGTSALELIEQCPGLDQVWVPVGGGGLAAGTVLAVGDEAEVVLAEPALAADARQSLCSGVLQGAMPPVSVADGLRTALGTLNFAILRAAGVAVHLASEAGIEAWVARASAILKVVVEPSAVVTLAAMAENAGAARGRVGVILSGGNL